MYPLLLLGMLGLAGTLLVAILGITSERGSQRPLILSTMLCAYGLFVFATGVIGWQMSVSRVEDAIAHVNPEDRPMLLAAGRSEARMVTIFGTAACLPPLVVGIAMFGLGVARLKRSPGQELQAAGTRR
jgi:hypothetical protein